METNYKKEHEELEIHLLHREISKLEEDNKNLKKQIENLGLDIKTLKLEKISLLENKKKCSYYMDTNIPSDWITVSMNHTIDSIASGNTNIPVLVKDEITSAQIIKQQSNKVIKINSNGEISYGYTLAQKSMGLDFVLLLQRKDEEYAQL